MGAHQNTKPIRRALKVPAVAKRIGAGESVTRQMIAAGVIPSYRIGRCIRVDADALEKWIADQSAARGDEAA